MARIREASMKISILLKSLFNSIWIITVLFILLPSCNGEFDPVYRDHMRDFVKEIGAAARTQDNDFIIIPQNGHELVASGDAEIDTPDEDYLAAIDGAGQEDLFFGYNRDDQETPSDENEYLLGLLSVCKNHGVTVLVTDYCYSSENMESSYQLNNDQGFISFAAPERELNIIPDNSVIYNENSADINQLSEAKNFLYLLNPDSFSSKTDYINKVSETNYDLVIMDLYYDGEQLLPSDIEAIHFKANGGKRLLICYMSIGEAEDYRYYWDSSWKNDPPEWLKKENPIWEGNYKVEYWNDEWKSIIYKDSDSYLSRILSTGFDGVYLDIIDAFEYFE